MKSGLTEAAVEKINTVLSHYPSVDQAVLYGSRAMGNFQNGSDIDLALKGEGLDLSLLYKLEIELDELYLPYKIDLALFSHISNPDLIDHINRVGVIFYSKKDHN